MSSNTPSCCIRLSYFICLQTFRGREQLLCTQKQIASPTINKHKIAYLYFKNVQFTDLMLMLRHKIYQNFIIYVTVINSVKITCF